MLTTSLSSGDFRAGRESNSLNMLKALEKGAFSVGEVTSANGARDLTPLRSYAIYKSRLGSAFHHQTCAEFADKEPHSKTIRIPILPGYHISVVSILHDNFCFLIVCENSQTCLAVDPADADHVVRAAQAEGLKLTGVLTTHGHWDHAGGNEQIRAKFPSVKVYGSRTDQVPGMTNSVSEGDRFWFPAKPVRGCRRIIVEVWEAPCHTKGHVMFLLTDPLAGHDEDEDEEPAKYDARSKKGPKPLALFTGDTLFSGGTGKFFEGKDRSCTISCGTAKQMADNLKRIAALPGTVKVFCGHEYTVNNYRFAAAVEPDNGEVLERLRWAERLRRDGLPTMPTSVGEEMATNPYMRIVTSRAGCEKLAMAMYEATGEVLLRDLRSDDVAVLGELRRIKDDNVLREKTDNMTALVSKPNVAPQAAGAAE